jgi:outer membrane biosynthesis protein TonB
MATKARKARKHENGFVLIGLVFTVLASACTHAHAKTMPDLPALEMPSPPAHDVEPIEVEPATSTPVTGEPEEPSRRATPARPRTTPTPPEPPKPEPKNDESRPASALQTAPATAEGEAERSIRATIARATTDLSHVDYRALDADGRSQYDQAKRLMRQADEAMREKNLVFARSVADKASTIAAQLARR